MLETKIPISSVAVFPLLREAKTNSVGYFSLMHVFIIVCLPNGNSFTYIISLKQNTIRQILLHIYFTFKK